MDCGEIIPSAKLADHLHTIHRAECIPYACTECGYQSSCEWKVRLHISLKHPERADVLPVTALASGSNYLLFIAKYFPDVHIPVDEDDEMKMMKELRENSGGQDVVIVDDMGPSKAIEQQHETSSDAAILLPLVVTTIDSEMVGEDEATIIDHKKGLDEEDEIKVVAQKRSLDETEEMSNRNDESKKRLMPQRHSSRLLKVNNIKTINVSKNSSKKRK